MKRYKFNTTILAAGGGGAYVLFPYDVEQEFGTRGKVPVKATFDGLPYSGSLMKYGNPRHMLPVSKAIREQAGKSPGDTVEVELWKDDEPGTLAVPAEFEKAMKKEGVLPFFDSLSNTHRKGYCRWITDAKKQETRTRRLEKALEMQSGPHLLPLRLEPMYARQTTGQTLRSLANLLRPGTSRQCSSLRLPAGLTSR